MTAIIIVATVAAVVAWRTAIPAESAPPPAPTTSTIPGENPVDDGTRFVFIREVGDGIITFDPAGMLTGEAARRAAVADGVIGEGEDLPNDFYISNPVEDSVTLDVAPDAKLIVLTFNNAGEIVETEIKLNELAVAFTGAYAGHTIYGLAAGEFPVTIEVADGIITHIEQVYLP